MRPTRTGRGSLRVAVVMFLAAALGVPGCEKATHDAARREFRAIMAGPKDPDARARALEAFVRDYPEPKTNTDLPRACVLVADHHAREDRLDLAAAWYERALAARPDDPDLLNALGYFYAEHRLHLDRAAGLLERAVRLAEEQGYAAYPLGLIKDSLGWCYRMRDDLPKAVALLEEACRLAPGVPILQEHLAESYRAIGDRERAAALFLELYEKTRPGHPAARDALVAIAREADPAMREEIQRRLRKGPPPAPAAR